eukprot:1320214-Amorphochlora_amoeboformis.AAC.1
MVLSTSWYMTTTVYWRSFPRFSPRYPTPSHGVNKGVATTLLINTLSEYLKEPLYLMAVGDDVSDEKMFNALQNNPLVDRYKREMEGKTYEEK